jgi:hypothetical protein
MSGLELLKGLSKHRHIYLGLDYLVIWDDGRSASLRVPSQGRCTRKADPGNYFMVYP